MKSFLAKIFEQSTGTISLWGERGGGADDSRLSFHESRDMSTRSGKGGILSAQWQILTRLYFRMLFRFIYCRFNEVAADGKTTDVLQQLGAHARP